MFAFSDNSYENISYRTTFFLNNSIVGIGENDDAFKNALCVNEDETYLININNKKNTNSEYSNGQTFKSDSVILYEWYVKIRKEIEMIINNNFQSNLNYTFSNKKFVNENSFNVSLNETVTEEISNKKTLPRTFGITTNVFSQNVNNTSGDVVEKSDTSSLTEDERINALIKDAEKDWLESDKRDEQMKARLKELGINGTITGGSAYGNPELVYSMYYIEDLSNPSAKKSVIFELPNGELIIKETENSNENIQLELNKLLDEVKFDDFKNGEYDIDKLRNLFDEFMKEHL